MSLEHQFTELTRQFNLLRQEFDNLVKPEVGRWIDWTPAVIQSGSVAVTVVEAKYRMSWEDIRIYCHLTVTGTGTAANAIIVSGWPSTINPSPGPNTWPVGVGVIVDQGIEIYEGVVSLNINNTQVSLWSPTTNTWVGANPSFALVSGDIIYFNMYWKI